MTWVARKLGHLVALVFLFSLGPVLLVGAVGVLFVHGLFFRVLPRRSVLSRPVLLGLEVVAAQQTLAQMPAHWCASVAAAWCGLWGVGLPDPDYR